MFGSNSSSFGAFGQSSNNNNQNTSGANTFGSFGTPATSQGTSFFGQPQQQQTQQQSTTTGANPFAGFGSTTSQSTPSFGGFNNNAQQGSTGFGFGGAVTTTPAFGSSTGGLFNTNANTANTPAFGSQPVPSGLFGNTTSTTTPSTTTFGASGGSGGSGLFGATTAPLAIQNGTANPPFTVFSEKEGTGTGTNHFQSITCMPAYSTSSFEELRVQDYQQNRRFGNAQGATGFGNSGPFSATPQSNSLFGGNAPAQASPFGSAATGSMFGQKSTPNGGMFGQSQNSNAFATNGGMFGNASQITASAPAGNTFGTNASNTGGLFGATNSSTNPSANTGFTQNNNIFGSQPQNTSGIFGGSNTNTNNTFGLNSNSSQKPFTFGGASTTPFGQSNTAQGTGGMFGSTPTTMNPANTSNGMFGQNNQVSQSSSTNSNLFGNPTQTTPASTNSFSFGGGAPNANSSNSVAQPATSGFSFGSASANTSTQKPFSFGTSAPTTNTFGTNANNNANAKPFSFGNSNATTNNPSGGLFGQNNNNTSTSGTPSLFGGQNSSLFGSTNGASASNPNTNTGLFGKPSTNSLFGQGSASTSNPGGLFGSGGQNNGSNTSTGTLFGSSQTQSGNNLFTQTMDNRGANNLQTSLAGNAYGSNPLFASVQGYNSGLSPMNSPTATPLVTNSIKKKPAMLPQFKLAPRSPATTGNLLYSRSAAGGSSSSKSAQKTGFTVFDEDLLINPEAFSPRTNIKRLIIDRKANDLNLLSGGLDMKGTQHGPPSKITELNSLEHRHKTIVQSDAQPSIAPEENSDRGSAVPSGSTGPIYKSSSNSQLADNKSTQPVFSQETDGDYWTVPALSKLLDYSKAELSRVSDFKIGRRGYGQVSFSAPVDLSSLEQVEDVAGKIVVFDDKMCTVYPDENLKPSFGKGLNQPATVTLEKCYPLSRDKREPIRDTEHPRFQQHVNRLKRMAETEFVDYLADSGTWIFKVKHF